METLNTNQNSISSSPVVPVPQAKIFYNHKNITDYISPDVLSVSYTDNEHGQSDEIDIKIQDKDHLWKSNWYPTKGDTVNISVGYEGQTLIDGGAFEIDELEISGPPDTMNIRGVSAHIKKPLRQKNSVAHENTSLKQIADKIAKKHGYTVVGNIKDVKIKRQTQNKKRDLTFLKELAESYGYIFKITGNKLVFFEIEELHNASSIITIDRSDISSFTFTDKTIGTYGACEVSYFDPKTKKLITYTEKRKDSKSEDTLKLNVRCENKQQAILKAKAGLAGKVKEVDGNISLMGNSKLVAGSNFDLTGFYKFSGKYYIKTAKHSIDKSSGYKTELEVYKIA